MRTACLVALLGLLACEEKTYTDPFVRSEGGTGGTAQGGSGGTAGGAGTGGNAGAPAQGGAAPSAGTSYPITLGETFLAGTRSHSYCSLRYDFKPASAGRLRQGSLQLQDNQASGHLNAHHDTVSESSETWANSR